jgi:hypothetical protein
LNAVQLAWSLVESSKRPSGLYLQSIPCSSIAPLPTSERFVILTTALGAGSTGAVYQGVLGGIAVAVKVVDILHRHDHSKRCRLQTEFNVYTHLEELYMSQKLARRIAPQCYGAFKSKRPDILVMGLHGIALSNWDDLIPSER